ncbi:hypothetical protein DXG03_009147 [Asterophora parasitica]|uniref:Ubiquitin-like-conjugating enzyme ATG10 n=1 Tax=Asterophora parasitica TaxID=117018 RepID=A0A9P7G4Q6_9AGAR|nr:hypothetical protein DXG03_009147 [Asterophora parasitica]
MLTRDQFEIACKQLIAAKSLVDARRGWSWNEHPVRWYSPQFIYVSLISAMKVGAQIRLLVPDLDIDLEESFTEEDDAATVVAPESFVSRQYIVYSATFQVPAFYFTMHDSKGAPLTLANLVSTSLFHPFAFEQTEVTTFGLTRPSSAFPMLSQGDHPTLGTPCWYLHPCETAPCVDELMSELDPEGYKEDQRLVRWLEMWFMVLGTAVDARS